MVQNGKVMLGGAARNPVLAPDAMTAPRGKTGFAAYLTLCPAEPFRIFFPLGMLFGISGVSLWPLFHLGIHASFHPGMMHARMMIEGFLGAFVFGFLGTALPRVTGAPPLRSWELWTLVVLHLTAAGLHIGLQPFLGDRVFLVLLVLFLVCMGRRFARRQDLPPPGFALVGLGFLNALAGTALLASVPWNLWTYAMPVGTALLNEGWVLLLILGIGGFLLPRFLGIPRPEFPKSRTPPPGWKPRALIAGATGVAITATLVAGSMSFHPQAADWVRCAAAGAYLVSTVPFYRAKVPNVTLTICLRVALVLLIAGLVFPLFWPLQRVAGLHVIFIGGFSLITLTVATRVILGHSGNSHLFASSLPFLIAAALLLATAAALRAIGDFVPATRNHWLNGASCAWMLGAAVWAWRVLPKVRIPDSEG
jgi:uncharacterized protein involved in response to NO